jgi:hypothetical protein
VYERRNPMDCVALLPSEVPLSDINEYHERHPNKVEYARLLLLFTVKIVPNVPSEDTKTLRLAYVKRFDRYGASRENESGERDDPLASVIGPAVRLYETSEPQGQWYDIVDIRRVRNHICTFLHFFASNFVLLHVFALYCEPVSVCSVLYSETNLFRVWAGTVFRSSVA